MGSVRVASTSAHQAYMTPDNWSMRIRVKETSQRHLKREIAQGRRSHISKINVTKITKQVFFRKKMSVL